MFQVIALIKNIIVVLGAGTYEDCQRIVKSRFPEVHCSLLPDKTYNTFTGFVQINSISDEITKTIVDEAKKDKDLDNIIATFKEDETTTINNQDYIIRSLVDRYDEFLNISSQTDDYWDAVNEYIDKITESFE